MKEFLSMSQLVDYLGEHGELLERPYLIEIEYSQSNWRVAKITLHDDKPLR